MADKHIYCEPCSYVSTEIEAVGFCVTCGEGLCSKCIIEHRKVKVTRNHDVYQDSIPDDADVIKKLNEMLACPDHKEMKISYKCQDHSACICTVCRIDTHRNCERVFEITKHDASDEELESVQENLETLNISTSSLKRRKEKNKIDLDRSRAEILSEQNVVIQKAAKSLEELKVKFEKETNEQMQVAVSDIDKDIESIECIEQNVKKNIEILKAAKKYGDNTSPRIIGYILAIDTTLQQNMVKDLDKKKDHQLLFTKNEDCIQVSSLGTVSLNTDKDSEIKPECVEICIEKTSDEVSECDASSFHAGKAIVHRANHNLPTISESFSLDKKVINVGVDTDSNYSSIYGILVLTDGRLLAIDNENSNIKLFSSDYKLLHVLRLPGRPIRLCSIRQNEVAVSFEIVKRINRYSVAGNAICYNGGFATTLFNHGIGFDGKNIVAIMCDEDYSCRNNAKKDTIQVEFRDPFNGNINYVIKDFKVVGNKTWSLVLKNTQALKFTEDGNMVLAEINRILCFGIQEECGKMVAIEKMFYVCQGEVPKGGINDIAIDSESIFVCTSSGCVFQLSSSDFSSNRIIELDTGKKLNAIAVDRANGRLILGCNEKDEILVYEAKRKV